MSLPDPLPAARIPSDGRGLLAVAVTCDGVAIVLRVGGEIDFVTAGQVERAIGNALANRAPHVTTLIIDLTEVGFLDAAGLRVLLLARRRCGEALQLRLVVRSDAVLRPFQLTDLDLEFALYPSLDDALYA